VARDIGHRLESLNEHDAQRSTDLLQLLQDQAWVSSMEFG
jgi:hypothetical protein